MLFFFSCKIAKRKTVCTYDTKAFNTHTRSPTNVHAIRVSLKLVFQFYYCFFFLLSSASFCSVLHSISLLPRYVYRLRFFHFHVATHFSLSVNRTVQEIFFLFSFFPSSSTSSLIHFCCSHILWLSRMMPWHFFILHHSCFNTFRECASEQE